MREISAAWQTWMWGLVAIAGAMVAGAVVHALFWWTMRRREKRSPSPVRNSAIRHLRRPTALILPIIAIHFVAPFVRTSWSEHHVALFGHFLTLGLIASIAWALVRLLSVAEDLIGLRYDMTALDNLDARRSQTRFRVLKNIGIFLIVLVAVATALMTFEDFRRVGIGVLSSAGVIGVVVGFAAQNTLAGLLAGIQIAITQPIRLDDVVIVEGEWGRIEEITLTYVVVKIWDLRRLVLPVSYFLEQPFQNWTRTSSEVLGTVYLHVDYTVPVPAIRAKLEEIVMESKEWDGRTCGVQVTNATPQTIEVRALMSAENASKSWTLRCFVRERLIAFLREEYPESLPRVRADIQGAGGAAAKTTGNAATPPASGRRF